MLEPREESLKIELFLKLEIPMNFSQAMLAIRCALILYGSAYELDVTVV